MGYDDDVSMSESKPLCTPQEIIKNVLIIGMLVTGSVNTLAKKWQNDAQSTGINGVEQYFVEPWTQTLFMYFGEALCIFGWFFTMYMENKRTRESLMAAIPAATYSDTPGSHAASYQTNSNKRDFALNDLAEVDTNDFFYKYPALTPSLFLMTSSLDLVGSTLAGIGLLYIPASVWQMLRGSIIIFSGILSVVFLKRKLYLFHWLGILTTTFGLAAVGVSSIFSSSSDDPDDGTNAGAGKATLGVFLVIVAQFFSAVQMIVQEIFLKKRSFPALQIVGSEGVWGIILMVFFVLPICFFIPGKQYGSYENSINAFIMIWNNWILMILTITYVCSIAFYNFFGLSVAKQLTTVHRTFIDSLRTVVVWAVELFLWPVTNHLVGQPWNNWSWLQLGGFLLLILGTLIYNAVFKIPGLYYPTKEQQEADNQK